MNRHELATRLVAIASQLVGAEEEEVDEAFASRIRGLKSGLSKLSAKKNKRLKQFGIEMIRPNATVEDLISAVEKVVGG